MDALAETARKRFVGRVEPKGRSDHKVGRSNGWNRIHVARATMHARSAARRSLVVAFVFAPRMRSVDRAVAVTLFDVGKAE